MLIKRGKAEIQQWLMDWFKQREASLSGMFEKQMKINYIEAKIIDSIGVIDLITSIESNFKIRFEEKHFHDKRFPVIKGLAEIIIEMLNENRS
jgi:acyl carrier protein